MSRFVGDVDTCLLYTSHSIYARSRDNARTPMQWSGEKNGGFTTGEPWFAVNPNYTRINAKEALEDENSVFYYYQKLIR